MKRHTLGGLAVLALLTTGCTTPAYENNHWHINNVAPRVSYHAAGYIQSVDGPYSQRLQSDADAFVLTLRRHLLNDNPDNPFLPHPVPKPYRPQPPDVEFKVANP